MSTQIIAHMSMSLDGFIAAEDDTVGPLFDWYDAGTVEVSSGNPGIRFHLDAASAVMMQSLLTSTGALVSGRHLFDLAQGWGDRHPIGAPVVVVTHDLPADAHRWPTTSFVPTVAEAIERARELAGDKNVVLASPQILGQAIDLDLVDEIAVSLVPVLLGSGKTMFGHVKRGLVRLDEPTVVRAPRATHLRYRVIR